MAILGQRITKARADQSSQFDSTNIEDQNTIVTPHTHTHKTIHKINIIFWLLRTILFASIWSIHKSHSHGINRQHGCRAITAQKIILTFRTNTNMDQSLDSGKCFYTVSTNIRLSLFLFRTPPYLLSTICPPNAPPPHLSLSLSPSVFPSSPPHLPHDQSEINKWIRWPLSHTHTPNYVGIWNLVAAVFQFKR